MTDFSRFQVAIVGAGIAGLICARQLAAAGYGVVVLEKSRGVGGRVATRRLHDTCADHGACYLSPHPDRFGQWLAILSAEGLIQVWTDAVPQIDASGKLQMPASHDRAPRYAAPTGMTAIAKFLAQGLDIRLNQRVQSITLLPDSRWQLRTAAADAEVGAIELTADAVILAIPAPQAVTLLQPLTEVLGAGFMQQLMSVPFFPCLSVMAGYPLARLQNWHDRFAEIKALTIADHPALGYVGLESSKRLPSAQAVFVVQSSAAFADRALDAVDLQPAGTELLQHAATLLADWLAEPDWLQVHRWRYAFAKSPLPQPYLLADTRSPLICTGDWCGGRKVEAAFDAGWATAAYLQEQLAAIVPN